MHHHHHLAPGIDIGALSQRQQTGQDDLKEILIIRIGKPRLYGQGIVWIQNVGRGGIVDNQCLVQRTTKPSQVLNQRLMIRKPPKTNLYKQSLPMHTGLTVKPMPNLAIDIQEINHRIGIL